ncbi:MAG: DUF559 domain-containing protein [Micromonosporaceae bacterium]
MAGRADLLRHVGRSGLDMAVRRGALVRLFPSAYADAERLGDPWLRWRAALLYAGAGAAFSHTSALRLWRLPGAAAQPPDPREPLHLTVPVSCRRRSATGVVLHRSHRGDRVTRGGFPVTSIELAIAQSWPLASHDAQRAPLIRAVSDRATTPDRIADVAATLPNLPGRAGLLALNGLLAMGCRSELELWGYAHVFSGPGLPPLRWQHPVMLGRRKIYLDVYAESQRVNFELDGARWHTSPEQRERDLRRDAALAGLGHPGRPLQPPPADP